jgi:hypothetical protein
MGVPIFGALLLAACGARERPPPPYFVIPPAPAVSSNAAPEAPPGIPRRPLTPPPNPAVQIFLPGHPEDVGRGPPPVPRPAAATEPFYAPPPNLGPVTGYGPGGMAAPPGSPPNPPYPPGGLLAPR